MSRDVLGLPIGVGVLFDALVYGSDLLIAVAVLLMETGEVWFTPLAVTAGTIAPEVSFLNQELLTQLSVFAATLYVGNLLRRRYNRYTNDDD